MSSLMKHAETLGLRAEDSNPCWGFGGARPASRRTTFASRRENPLKVDTAWKAVRENAGLGKLRLHDLRHSHAAVAVNGGEGSRVVAGLLGHAEPPPSATRTLRRVRCWTPRTGSRAALPRCSTAGRRTMTERTRLTDALALASQPREREYAIHDTALQGFMLRVQPTGARSWVFRFRRDSKPPPRVTLGKPGAVKADQAQAAALAFLAREKGSGKPLSSPPSGPTLSRFAAEYIEQRSPSWKPSKVKATLSYLNSAILPALGHLRVVSITRADVARFFHEYGRRRPGGANRCHEMLGTMFDCAVGWGHQPEPAGNPCKGIAATGDRRAVGCSGRSIWRSSVRSCDGSNMNVRSTSRRCG